MCSSDLYEDDPVNQEVAADMYNGHLLPKGKLPVSVCKELTAGTGITVELLPVAEKIPGINIEALDVIDSIANDAIRQHATPGIVVLVAKDGNELVPVDSRGRVQMVRNNNVETNGTGMQPNSEFAVYLFSDPILLGVGKTDNKGQFFASFPVEQELPIGDHTLQVNGFLADGKTASISVPVTLVDSAVTAKNQAMPKPQYVAVNPLDKALKALYWMLVVLAVMIFLITTANRKRFFALFRRRDDEEEPQTI